MRKFLILLLGLLLIGILSYFCFLDKSAEIKNDLASKTQSTYTAKQMNWVKSDIKGNDLAMTRIVTLEGTAPSAAFKAEAQRIALAQEGVTGVENRLIVAQASSKADIKSESVITPVDVEIVSKPEAIPIIDVEVTSKPEPIPIIDIEIATKPEPIPVIDVRVSSKVVEKGTTKSAIDSCQENLQKILSGKKINFASNKAIIKPDSYVLLNALAKVAQKCPKGVIEIGGYTDSSGNNIYNKKLSTIRANAVKKYLVKKGVSSRRLYAIGYGESKPIADNKTQEGQAKNRRIEFKIKSLKDIPSVQKTVVETVNFDDIPFAKTTKIDAKTARNLGAVKLGAHVVNIPREKLKIKKVQKAPLSAAALCQIEFKKILSHKKIQFSYNKADIKPSSYALLDLLTNIAKKCSDDSITISGYTDSDGSESYNKRLSTKRAIKVRAYLIDKGISSQRLKAVGYGEANPIADNSTTEGKAKNRRIEFNVKGVK